MDEIQHNYVILLLFKCNLPRTEMFIVKSNLAVIFPFTSNYAHNKAVGRVGGWFQAKHAGCSLVFKLTISTINNALFIINLLPVK